jgi:hypothetical protein
MTDNPESGGRWFYVHEGRRKGPVSVAQLAELILAQDLPEDTLIWRHGLGEWAAATSVDEIKRELPPPLPGKATDKPVDYAGAVEAEGLDGEGSLDWAEGREPGPDGPNDRTTDRKRRRRHRHRPVSRRPRWLMPLLIMVLILVVVLWYLLRRINEAPPGQIILQSALVASAEHRS